MLHSNAAAGECKYGRDKFLHTALAVSKISFVIRNLFVNKREQISVELRTFDFGF